MSISLYRGILLLSKLNRTAADALLELNTEDSADSVYGVEVVVSRQKLKLFRA
jgi:hypothetical protein